MKEKNGKSINQKEILFYYFMYFEMYEFFYMHLLLLTGLDNESDI